MYEHDTRKMRAFSNIISTCQENYSSKVKTINKKSAAEKENFSQPQICQDQYHWNFYVKQGLSSHISMYMKSKVTHGHVCLMGDDLVFH